MRTILLSLVSCLLLAAVFLATGAFAAEPPSQCTVTLVRAGKTEKLGEFQAKVGEETETIKSFAIPGSSLKAKISVFYTDESIRIEVSAKYVQDTSIRIALAVTDSDDDKVLMSSEASVAESAIISKTEEKNLVRAIKVHGTGRNRFAVIGECRSK